jgi:hypothetical protein
MNTQNEIVTELNLQLVKGLGYADITTELVDGKLYNLGAIVCRYNKKDRVFTGGNCFIHEGNTKFLINERAA